MSICQDVPRCVKRGKLWNFSLVDWTSPVGDFAGLFLVSYFGFVRLAPTHIGRDTADSRFVRTVMSQQFKYDMPKFWEFEEKWPKKYRPRLHVSVFVAPSMRNYQIERVAGGKQLHLTRLSGRF